MDNNNNIRNRRPLPRGVARVIQSAITSTRNSLLGLPAEIRTQLTTTPSRANPPPAYSTTINHNQNINYAQLRWFLPQHLQHLLPELEAITRQEVTTNNSWNNIEEIIQNFIAQHSVENFLDIPEDRVVAERTPQPRRSSISNAGASNNPASNTIEDYPSYEPNDPPRRTQNRRVSLHDLQQNVIEAFPHARVQRYNHIMRLLPPGFSHFRARHSITETYPTLTHIDHSEFKNDIYRLYSNLDTALEQGFKNLSPEQQKNIIDSLDNILNKTENGNDLTKKLIKACFPIFVPQLRARHNVNDEELQHLNAGDMVVTNATVAIEFSDINYNNLFNTLKYHYDNAV